MKARISTRAVPFSILAAFVAGLAQFFAQGEPPPAYVPVRMSAHETVYGKVSTTNGIAGPITVTNLAYTEIASGLNHIDPATGHWTPSREELEIDGNGYAVAPHGAYSVSISPVLNDARGVIELTTPEGKHICSTIVGLTVYDRASGTNLIVAEATNAIGRQIAPNQIVFENCFDNVAADVRFTYKRGSFHQDLILKESLNPDWLAANGLTPDETRLEIWTEVFDSPEPDVQTAVLDSTTDPVRRAQMAEPDLMEDHLDFGAMKIPLGQVYRGSPNKPGKSLAVPKRWVHTQGRRFIVESVDLAGLQPLFSGLPPHRDTARLAKTGSNSTRHIPTPRFAALKTKPALLAKGDYRERGVVCDYQVTLGTLTNHVWKGGTTYYLIGDVYCYPNTTFESESVLKSPFFVPFP